MTGRSITMSWVKSKRLWIVVLAVLIAAVNIVTAVVFLHYTLKPGKYEIFKHDPSGTAAEAYLKAAREFIRRHKS